jgi:hypothetical protein
VTVPKELKHVIQSDSLDTHPTVAHTEHLLMNVPDSKTNVLIHSCASHTAHTLDKVQRCNPLVGSHAIDARVCPIGR